MSPITQFTRCVGTRDARYVESVCPVRDSCERYTALLPPHGVMVVDARAMLCSAPDFKHRTPVEASLFCLASAAPAQFAAPQCGPEDEGSSVRWRAEKVTA